MKALKVACIYREISKMCSSESLSLFTQNQGQKKLENDYQPVILAGIFPSTFLQLVNGSKSSILN